MATTTYNEIFLSFNGRDDERPIDEATVASGQTVTPGEFLVFSSGDIKRITSAASTGVEVMVADRNEYKTTSGTAAVDTTFAAGDLCRFRRPIRGDKVYAWLEAGANVAANAALESGALGDLQAFTSGQILAFADEAKNNSGGGSRVRIRVRIA